jgi:hypothetical protein
MGYKLQLTQEVLKRVYEDARDLKEYNRELAEEYELLVRDHKFFKTEKEALTEAIKLMKANLYNYQIWAKIDKGKDGVYRVLNWWLVTNDNKVKLAAEHTGLALVYDSTSLLNIMDDNIPLDEVF